MAKAREIALELEELGYGALWFGEATGREALTNASLLLAGTKRMVIARHRKHLRARCGRDGGWAKVAGGSVSQSISSWAGR